MNAEATTHIDAETPLPARIEVSLEMSACWELMADETLASYDSKTGVSVSTTAAFAASAAIVVTSGARWIQIKLHAWWGVKCGSRR